MSLNAGHLDQLVVLQSRATGQDAHGQANGAWQAVATLWAQVQPLRGNEFFAAGQTHAEVDVRIRIRYRAGVLPTMRVLWRGTPHDIISVIEPNGGREQLELMCRTGARDGR